MDSDIGNSQKYDYNEQVVKLLNKLNATVRIEYIGRGFNQYWDKTSSVTKLRDIYNVTIKRGNNEMSFIFYDSIANTEDSNYIINEYDVLSHIIWVKSWISFNDFCDNFSYDTDSRRAVDVYLEVDREIGELSILFSEDERYELEKICV